MKRTEPLSIRQIVDQVLDASALSSQIGQRRAAFLWPQVVGPGIAAMTSRRYTIGRTLHVYINSGPLKADLAFRRQTLVNAINSVVGSDVIDNIIFH